MLSERELPQSGPRLLKELTANDSWIKKTYVVVARAGREVREKQVNITGIINRANQLQHDILSVLPTTAQPRPIDREKYDNLSQMISLHPGGVIIMRHGIQYIEDEERKSLLDPVRKIRLMQLPQNYLDPADGQSLAEAGSMALMLMHLSREMNLPVDIKTAQNHRAADIGAILSVVTGFNVSIDRRLTCVNYPADRSDDDLNNILGTDNKGALTWRKEVIDVVCGDGTFDTISTDVHEMIDTSRRKSAITVLLTHTPQTNAADVIAGEEPMRMPELGFRLFTTTASQRYLTNIFQS